LTPAHYSYSWANQRISELVGKYPRASRILCETFALETKDLAKYLATNDPLYPVLRGLIHSMDIYCRIHPRQGNDCVAVEYLRSHVKFIYTGEHLDRIDTGLKRAILKEQGSRGAGGGSDSDRLQLPFDFS